MRGLYFKRRKIMKESVLSAETTEIMYKFNCGMYLITVCDGIKDNGCIINSAVQITDDPVRIVFSLNKHSYTHKLLQKTGEFNLSVLDSSASRELIEHFGYKSGREGSKFTDDMPFARSKNGVLYLTSMSCAALSFENVALTDWDSHTLFTAELKDARSISDKPPMSYRDYREAAGLNN